MQQLIPLGILALYLISLLSLGWVIVKKCFVPMPWVLEYVGVMVIGIGVGVPITYLLSNFFQKTNSPIFWGTILFIAISIILRCFTRVKSSASKKPPTISELLSIFFAIIFSSWLMIKTFRGGAGGTLFVGSNNIFDFGNALGIIRSFSWGSNIPFMSPFRAGLPLFYHFLFYYFIAIWEYFGVSIVWAVNIVSIFSFAAMLLVVYYFPQIVAKQKSIVGWIAVFFTITNSSLTFWQLLIQKGLTLHFLSYIWHLSAYPYAGPFDGSTISLFMTLNNYVNQRHLAFGIALGLFLIMTLTCLLDEKRILLRKVVIIGAVTGSLFLWNMTICASVGVILGIFLGLKKQWRKLVAFSVPALTIVIISCIPFVAFFKDIWSLIAVTMTSSESGGIVQSHSWNMLAYLWENLGLLPLVVVAGLIVVPKKSRLIYSIFFTLFFLGCMYAGIVSHGFDQKFLSFFIIGINILAAGALGWLVSQKNFGVKMIALGVVFVLMVSGFVDLMPIKNEFSYPFIGKDTAPLVSWIRTSTPKNAVFVSYADEIDPVVLAGRQNYFGFFGNIGSVDRSSIVSQIYQGNLAVAQANNISYILVPKWKKNDFPYIVNIQRLKSEYETVYDDAKFTVFQIGNSLPAITIINPIRDNGLGHETDDLVASLKAQWQVTHDAGVHATWLFQYGALENSNMTAFAKQEMGGEEFGLLFEIDRNYAEKSGVQFRGQGPWYASDGLLLDSYDSDERHRLIDTAFSQFKNVFGQYPKTVGAWWIGGDSLTYMQEKYGITAAMRAADQFNLDAYSLWGTPWDIPYLPSKTNEGMPAASFDTSSKVVMLQWAIRDPVRGYTDPLYSLQDYYSRGYTTAYVNYLASIYLQKPFGNMVMGLENGGNLTMFQQAYKTMLTKAKELQTSGKANIVLARDYAQNYLSQKKVFAGQSHFLSMDYASSDQSFWYLSENYRAYIQKKNNKVSLVDLRNYADKIPEDFETLPNSQPTLRINEPAIIDTVTNPDQSIHIETTNQPLTLKENGNDVTLFAGNDKIAYFTEAGCTFFVKGAAAKMFTFVPKQSINYLFYIVIGMYILYFGISRFHKKDIFFSLIPLLLAIPFLINTSTFLFDKKETVLLSALFAIHVFPVLTAVYVCKILPFFLLFVFHKINKRLYWIYLACLCFLYFHLPYFPLDKTTYVFVGASFACIAILLTLVYFFFYKKHVLQYGVISLLLFSSFAVATVYSRSKLALPVYEIDALQFLNNQHKNVLYEEQVDNHILPIYKEVKPLLIMGTHWQVVMRPDDNVLKTPIDDNTLLVIPRYMGADISAYEISKLHLKKIFDNTQIAIFEKDK